jgi:5'-3' exonuclease
MEKLVLERACPHVQIVDGNNFLLQAFHQNPGGLVVRTILDDIQSCQQPPIFVFDGVNGNLRRRNLFPDYKVRTEVEQSYKSGSYPTLELFRQLIGFTKAITIRVPSWEADDVIATIALSRAGIGSPVKIVSTDRDLSQLAVNKDIHVSYELEGVRPDQVRLYKTLVGDKSDKIPGLVGFGKIAWSYINHPLFQKIFEGAAGTPSFGAYTAADLGLKDKQYEYLTDNQALMQCYWEITGLMDVPMTEIVPNMTVGSSKMAEADTILRSYML